MKLPAQVEHITCVKYTIKDDAYSTVNTLDSTYTLHLLK